MAPTLLQQAGAIKVSKLLPLEFCHFFTHVLMRNGLNGCKGDLQVPNAKAIMDHEVMFDAVLEKLWPTVEEISGEIVLPSYAYSRLYTNGDTLEKHTDRPACEVSMTIQLGRSHHYAWPIYMGGNRYDLAEGDAVIYSGCDIEHWREKCDGPPDYYSGQLFLHYVRKDGQYKDHAGDSTNRTPPEFIKYRTNGMESK